MPKYDTKAEKKISKVNGTFHKSKENFAGIDANIKFFRKADNINGLQIADYCVYPFARHAKNPDDEGNQFLGILRRFIYQGDYGEYGLKGWP
jgi:hypothetical protein